MRGYAPDTSEATFQRSIIGLAEMYGWLVYHTHDSRRSEAGFPDLTMARGDRLILAELKTKDGRMSDAQKTWRAAIENGPAEYYLWRPADLEEIVATLGPRRAT